MTVNVTYLVGGFFFSLGGYVSILLVVNGSGRPGSTAPADALVELRPRRRAWRSAVVLFVGTLFFAVSLVAAFAEGLTPRQSNGWIWLPDILGCVCFLVSGHLAHARRGRGPRPGARPRLGWWVVAVNQVGSVLFFLAGLAAFTRPATSRPSTSGSSTGGRSPARSASRSAGSSRSFDTPTPTRTVVQPSHDEAQ